MQSFVFRSIRSLLAWSLGLSLILAFSFITLVVVIVLDKRFQTLEQREVRLQIDRLRDLIQNEVENLNLIIKDWGEWDEMRNFVLDSNAEFVKMNLYPEVLHQLSIDSFRVYTLQGKLVHALDKPKEKVDDIDLNELLQGITLDSAIFPSASEREPKTGLVALRKIYLRYAVLPIRDSKSQLAPTGFVVFFKIIDQEFETKLQQLSKNKLQMRFLDERGIAPSVSETLPPSLLIRLQKKIVTVPDSAFFVGKKSWVRMNDSTIMAALVAQDSKGADRLLIEFPIDRVLVREGKKIISGMVYSFIGVTVMVLLFQLIVVTHITGRLQDLVQQLGKLSIDHAPGQRLRPRGKDELRSLVHSFNGLLEAIDAQQASMRSILENVRSGFLLVNSQGLVQEGATRLASQMLGQEKLEGQSLIRLLCKEKKDQDHFQVLFEQLFDPIIPIELSLSQIPQKFILQTRHLSIDWVPLLNAKGEVGSILCTLHDVTHLEEVEHESETNLALMKILRNRAGFQALLEDIRESLCRSKKILATTSDVGHIQKSLRRTLHTIKGNLGIFGLRSVAKCVHEIEDREHIGRTELEAIEQALIGFLQANFAILEADYESSWDPYYRVFRSQLEDFRVESQHWVDIWQAQRAADSFIHQLMLIPAQQLLEPLLEDARRLASKCEKKVRIELIGGSLKIDSIRYRNFLKNLVHAIRNSVIHGIEKPHQRKGKPEIGLISIEWRETNEGSLIFCLQDDGQGIPSTKLKDIARQRGFISTEKAARLSEAEAQQLIFLDGLSTESKANDFAGRGVGMSAWKQAVEELGGEITVKSQLGQGTSFVVVFPKSSVSLMEPESEPEKLSS